MTEITLNIPDNKYQFFLELINKIGIETKENRIPEEHKTIVRERIRTAKPDNMTTWEDARKSFSFKNKHL